MSDPTPLGHLTASADRLRALDDHAIAELDSSWRALLDVVEQQAAACRAAPDPAPADIAALRALRAIGLQRCLIEPLRALDRRAPDRRALAAIDLHASTMDAWIRSQPDAIPVSGADAVATARAWGARSVWGWLAGRRTRPRTAPLRRILTLQARRLAPARDRMDGAWLSGVADAMQQLSRTWSVSRLHLDAVVDRSITSDDLRRARDRLAREHQRVLARTATAIEERRAWLATRFLPAVGAALVRAIVRRRMASDPIERGRTPWMAHWRRQSEDVRAELELALALERHSDALLAALENTMASAAAEDAALHAELDRMMALLQRNGWRSEDLHVAVVWTPASARLAEMDRVAQDADGLPETARLVDRPTARPLRYAGPRLVRPRATFAAWYERDIRPSCAALFEVIESYQSEVANDLQRACDVVAFAASAIGPGEPDAGDASDASGGGGGTIGVGADTPAQAPVPAQLVVSEAVLNATALLEFRRNTPSERQVDGMRAAAAICRAGRDAYLSLFGTMTERGAVGVRRQWERHLPRLSSALEAAAGRAVASATGAMQRATNQLLVRIGWRRRESPGAVDVQVRPSLPREFAGDPYGRDLPALYRHLFRPEPVDDPRFLVGRETELEAFAAARERWESERSAAVLITGERGSGKTSLVNCALLGPLAALPVARGEFRERLLTVESMRGALSAIVGAPDAERGLEEHLSRTRQVVVIEEFERAFLRHIGHYDAVRAFGRLINATAASTLWIVVVNQVAFRFLHAMMGLGQRFSHRINAGSATADDLRQAIMARHHLSGLRLWFEPAREDGRVPHLLRLTRRGSAEAAFFQLVARQSAGVYRTAFNVWLGHIAGIRDGLVSMRAPSVKDIAPVIDDLALVDLFTLVAVLQHGSLTPEEHAVVFQQPIEVSRAHIEELIAREIIAADPGRPGYRVRPEAMGVVQEALFRRNLL